MKRGEWALSCTLYMEEHLKENLTVEALSAWAGYSPWYFSRCFKEKVGASPMEYLSRDVFCGSRRNIKRPENLRCGSRLWLGYPWRLCQSLYQPVRLFSRAVKSVSSP